MRGRVSSRLLRVSGRVVVGLILAFIVLPAVVVTIAAFNERAILSFPPTGTSTRWFTRALTYRDFRTGLWNSLVVTAWASTLALAVGTGFAIALKRYAFRFKGSLEGVLLSPLIVPHFTIGLGLLMLATGLSVGQGWPVLVLTHVIVVLPFVIRSVYISLQNIDERLELAAASLGARPRAVLTTITLPLLAPGLVSGWLFAAILSFNEFTASLFVTNQATQTLPVAMYGYVREFADPTLAAVSVIYIAVTAALLTLANTFLGLGKVLNVEQGR
ncbi:MAG: ABC transporter permease [Parafilimonas terrae]|nr:ABC transporter permease [Parafilimonas terrae]